MFDCSRRIHGPTIIRMYLSVNKSGNNVIIIYYRGVDTMQKVVSISIKYSVFHPPHIHH